MALMSREINQQKAEKVMIMNQVMRLLLLKILIILLMIV